MRARVQRRNVGVHYQGDLRRALIDAAAAILDEVGADVLSLREVARRIGVSHAAPAHHFGDKAGLLTAIATQGFELLGDALRAAHAGGGFLDVGIAYIAFAVEHPAHFDVMVSTDLYIPDDPGVVAARAVTSELLYGPAAEVAPNRDVLHVGIAGWAFAHGFATLWNSGNLQHRLGDDPIQAARVVGRVLFTGPRD